MLLQYLCLIINHQFNSSRQCLILNLKYSQVTYLPSEEHFQLRHYSCWEKGYELIFPYSILLLYAVLLYASIWKNTEYLQAIFSLWAYMLYVYIRHKWRAGGMAQPSGALGVHPREFCFQRPHQVTHSPLYLQLQGIQYSGFPGHLHIHVHTNNLIHT